jgi:hypothetical protein
MAILIQNLIKAINDKNAINKVFNSEDRIIEKEKLAEINRMNDNLSRTTIFVKEKTPRTEN